MDSKIISMRMLMYYFTRCFKTFPFSFSSSPSLKMNFALIHANKGKMTCDICHDMYDNHNLLFSFKFLALLEQLAFMENVKHPNTTNLYFKR